MPVLVVEVVVVVGVVMMCVDVCLLRVNGVPLKSYRWSLSFCFVLQVQVKKNP